MYITQFLEQDGFTYVNETGFDPEILTLPEDLLRILQNRNGFIWRNGALHFRGVVTEPEWHSLDAFWHGNNALASLYDCINTDDIPFGQDCFGDQFFLRNNRVFRLLAESGDCEIVADDLNDFFRQVLHDPEGFLSFNPKMTLEPGQLWHVYPPFCTEKTENGYSFRACPAIEVYQYHSDLSRTISKLADGESFKICVTE